MASKGSRRARTRRSTTKPRRTHCEKRSLQVKNQESSTSSSSPICSDSSPKVSNTTSDSELGGEKISGTNCSTPKAQRFRIPKIETCPPAPKKQRVMSSCRLRRRPIAFFAPPDIELFFFFALRGISV